MFIFIVCYKAYKNKMQLVTAYQKTKQIFSIVKNLSKTNFYVFFTKVKK